MMFVQGSSAWKLILGRKYTVEEYECNHRRGVRVWQEVCLDLTQVGVALEGA